MVACAPPIPETPPVTCPTLPLVTGQAQASSILCAAMLFSNGDGSNADLWIGNDKYRAVLRHPQASLSLAGLGGGTIVDAAAWGRGDIVYEIAPLVEGGWLDVDDVEFVDDGIAVSGLVRSLPAHAATAEGDRQTVTWRTAPGDPWLHADGATGFWIETSAAATRVDGWLMADPVVLGHDGTVTEDLGGTIVVDGATSLLFSDTTNAWALRPGDHQHISGTAPDAADVDLLSAGVLVGRVPVATDGSFDATIAANVDGLRAISDGRASSAIAAPGEAVSLAIGGTGGVMLQPVWPTGVRQRPIGVQWSAADGRGGLVRMEPGGASIPTGAGAIDMVLTAGPAWSTRKLHLELLPGDQPELEVSMKRAMAGTGNRVLASLSWEGGRARTQGVASSDRTRAAVVAGYEMVVGTAQDDVSSTTGFLNDTSWIRSEDGTTLTSPAGWSIGAWPWGEDSGRSGHGVPRIRDLSPLDALLLAWGGPSIDRYTLVDLTVLGALDEAPWTIEPTPSFVQLDTPGGPPFDAWSPWFKWLDAGRFVRPSGPDVWLDVGTPNRYGPVEISRALNTGSLGCGNGAWLNMHIDGYGPGDVVPKPKPDTDVDSDDSDGVDSDGVASDSDTAPPGPPTHVVVVDLHLGESKINRVSIVTQGKGLLGTFTPENIDYRWTATLELGDWTTAIAWSTTTSDWATVTPVWTRSPGGKPSTDTDTPADTDKPGDTP